MSEIKPQSGSEKEVSNVENVAKGEETPNVPEKVEAENEKAEESVEQKEVKCFIFGDSMIDK